ncbi:TPA: DUF4376 domain-containing protein, partial [Escherichia coli]|nr:DUF4376 domain-containing protein [Escherichia coli]
MNNFKNFTSNTPDSSKSELAAAGFLFLQDEDGNDWYECQGLFSENTKKIVYNSDGVVLGISEDVSSLWPAGMSVAEVEALPEGCDTSGRWVFDGEQVTDSMKPEQALANKTAEINAWRDAQEQGNVVFEAEGYSWDASLSSKTRIEPVMALVTAGALPEGFFWTDADNEDIPATEELLTAIYEGMQQALVEQGFSIHERQRQMK